MNEFDQELRSVYRAELPRVHGYLLWRLGGRRALAEELTQDVFVAYVGAARRGEVIDNPRGWLITVARNALVACMRRAEVSDRHAHRLGALAAAPVDELAENEAERAALELLDDLPVDQRLAMILRYVDDLPVADVADLMGRSASAVESLLARARRSLRGVNR